MKLSHFLAAPVLLSLLGCAANAPEANRLTLGTVQQTVSKGANQTAIMEALGAPNIITNDSGGREVWTYDKIYRESQSRSGVVVTWWNPITWLAGLASGSASRSSATSKSLTVLITFDDDKRVADFKYQRLEF